MSTTLSKAVTVLLALLSVHVAWARPYSKGEDIKLREYVGKTWSDELIHYALEFEPGHVQDTDVRLVDQGGRLHPVQLSDIARHADGSLRSADLWTVVSLAPHETITWRVEPGASPAKADLASTLLGKVLEVTTARTGARFHIGENEFDVPIEARHIPTCLTSIRHRSGTWGGRGWFETPHTCTRYRTWIMDTGPVFVRIGFEYEFDGFGREGGDIYRGHVRVAARQEVIEIVEEFALGDPKIYRMWQPADRAEAIMWDWWQWRPHEASHSFCFSIHEGLEPTKARWYGHNSTIPEKRTGRNPGMDFETDYTLDYGADRFDIMVNSYHRGCPDQALSYLAWREGDPQSDALAVIGIRPTEWRHPDMLPHLASSIVHHTDTACLRIYAQKKPDLVIKAPLHLGRRAWGLTTLQMPEAGPTEDDIEDGKVVRPAYQKPSQALQLRSKYGNRQLDKVKDWALEWESRKTYPSLFVKDGGLDAVLARIRSSRVLVQHAASQKHKPIMRYILERGEGHAKASFDDLMDWCRKHIEILFEHGYCSHRGTNNNQYPWWMQEMSARFDLVMGMPEITDEQKETLKAYFSFCVHMLQDDDFMPPRETGVGWGSANMPINTRGGRAVSAAVLSDNPDAGPWFERSVEYVDALVNKVWAEDGSPVSGPHYVTTQADPLINMALPLYYAGALPPLQEKYPRIRNFTRLLIDRLTPPDRRAGNTRILPTIGHTRLETCSNIGKYAVLMNLTDRKLAGRAYWLWKRSGGNTTGFMDGIYYMHENFEEVEPTIGSSVYPGSLTFLRNGFPHPNETYMAIHCGSQGFDHYDRDVGAFLLYAKGVPLMMDFCSMYTPNCWQSTWHNTLSWNVVEQSPKTPCPGRDHADCWFTGKYWKDHAYEPHELLDRAADRQSEAADAYKEQAGEITNRVFTPHADYVCASIPLVQFDKSVFYDRAESENPVPWAAYQQFDAHRLERRYNWQRRFVFVKDADLNGPNYFVIQDDLDGQAELSPTANFWCLADEMTVEKDTVRWRGQYEIDLDMYIAWPKKPEIAQREWWHTSSQPIHVDWKDKREYQVAAHVQNEPGNGGFTVLLYPRGRFERAPSFNSTRDGTAVSVQIGERRDVIFCARERAVRKLGGATLDGTVAVIKATPASHVLSLLEPGTLRADAITLEATTPTSLTATDTRLVVECSGAGDLKLALHKRWAEHEALIEGTESARFDASGTLTLQVPEGGCRIVSTWEPR